MGTVRGITKYVAPAAVAGALIAGGGQVYTIAKAETCVRVPAGIAALSEPAFAALKADHIIIEGLLGWHYTYDPVTKLPTESDRLYSMLFILIHGQKHGDLIKYDNLEATSPSLFFVRGVEFDQQIVDWRDLQAAGYDIKSTSDALETCEVPNDRGYADRSSRATLGPRPPVG